MLNIILNSYKSTRLRLLDFVEIGMKFHSINAVFPSKSHEVITWCQGHKSSKTTLCENFKSQMS